MFNPNRRPLNVPESDDLVTKETWIEWVEWKLTCLHYNYPSLYKGFMETLRDLKAGLEFKPFPEDSK